MTWTNTVVRYNNSKNQSSPTHLKQVTIATEVDEENMSRILTQFTPPVTSGKWSNGKTATKIIDLLRIEERITIDGYIVTGLASTTTANVDGNGDDTYSEENLASDKKDDLKDIYKAGGTCWLEYMGTNYQGIIEKLQVKGEVKDGLEPNDSEVGYSVKFTFIKGVDQ